MADAFCIVCGAGMTGDEAALNYKYISRQCRDFLCPACLGKKLGLSPDIIRRAQTLVSTENKSFENVIEKLETSRVQMEKEREEEHIFDLAGGGFESTVRLAKSSAATWVPILLRNKYNVLDVLREHIHQLQIMRRMLERDDAEGLKNAMERANTIQRIIR